MIRSLMNKIRRDSRGAYMVEFALITPPFFIMLLGLMDFGHSIWMRATIEGVIEEASRDSGLEGGAVVQRQQIIDEKLRDAIETVSPNATVTISRRYYKDFTEAAAAKAETFTDTNKNRKCDAGEPYMDANHNSKWDSDGADDGQGGAKDVVIITAKVQYDRLMPMAGLLGWTNNTVEVDTNSVLANQPYGDQDTYGAPVQRNCA